MRDRLIELLRKDNCCIDIDCSKCMRTKSHCYPHNVADKILADGWFRPPCNVGDTVYDISEFFDGTNCPEIYEYAVERIEITEEKGKQVLYIADLKYPSDDWGKTLHFSREEAEQALGKLQASYKQVKGGVE